MTRKLSRTAKDRIRALYSQERPVGAIADLYGVSRWTVHSVCKDLVQSHPATVTEEMVQKLKQMHEDGVPGAVAAQKVGVSIKTVYRHW